MQAEMCDFVRRKADQLGVVGLAATGAAPADRGTSLQTQRADALEGESFSLLTQRADLGCSRTPGAFTSFDCSGCKWLERHARKKIRHRFGRACLPIVAQQFGPAGRVDLLRGGTKRFGPEAR